MRTLILAALSAAAIAMKVGSTGVEDSRNILMAQVSDPRSSIIMAQAKDERKLAQVKDARQLAQVKDARLDLAQVENELAQVRALARDARLDLAQVMDDDEELESFIAELEDEGIFAQISGIEVEEPDSKNDE